MGDPKPRQRFRPGNDIAKEPFFGGAAKGEAQMHTPMAEEAVSFLSDASEAPTVLANPAEEAPTAVAGESNAPIQVESIFENDANFMLVDSKNRLEQKERERREVLKEAATEMVDSAARVRTQEAATTVVRLDDHRTPRDLQSIREVERESTTVPDDEPVTVDAMLPKKTEQRPIGTRIQEYLETKIKPGNPALAQVRVEAAINTLRTLEEAYRDMSDHKQHADVVKEYADLNEAGERQFKWQLLLNEVQQNSLFVPDGVKIKVKETDLENMALNDEIALIQSLRLRLQLEADAARVTNTRPMVDETIVHKRAASA